MSHIATRTHERASECWGLYQSGQEFWLRSNTFAQLDPDDYVFPHREIAEDDFRSRAILKSHCRDALCVVFEHAWSAARDAPSKDALEKLLKSVPLREALDLGRRIRGDWYAGKARSSNDESEDILALETLCFLLNSGDPHLPHDMSLLIRTAFHAALNPVTICPSAFSQGELLTVGAWLGMLSRGRRAMMPKFVASYWLMLLQDADDWPQSAYEPDSFILSQGARLFSFEHFKAQCQQAVLAGSSFIEAAETTCRARVLSGRLARFDSLPRILGIKFGSGSRRVSKKHQKHV